MNPDLQRLQRAIGYSLRGLDAAQTQLRPKRRNNRWSIQQIIEHLLLTYSSTETTIDARLEKRTPTRSKPGVMQHMAQYTVIRLGYFPHGRKAPPMVMPAETITPLSGEDMTRSADEHLIRLEAICDEAEKLFGAGRCASHHVLGPLSIPQWRKFHLIHGEHHVRQILAIRKAHGV